MKGSRISHKSQNTFRFQTFSERIANVNIDVIHRIGFQSQTPEEADTFLKETLDKWNELNCTQSFDFFKEDLGRDVITLSQLVHNKDEMVACLEKHLQIKGSLALLELVVALARDLQSDFYPEFPKFFKIIFQLLRTRDPDVLEWSFTCLSYLFKFLWRFMIKDIKKVFLMYLPLLNNSQPEHIRNFAAESFAFLIRKVPDKGELLDYVFLRLENKLEYSEGVGQLLFEVIKGVKEQFHSCIETLLPIIFSKLGSINEKDNAEFAQSIILKAEFQMCRSICTHSNKNYMVAVWKIIENYILNSIIGKESEPKLDFAHLENLLKIVQILASHRNGDLIEKPNNYANFLSRILKIKYLPDSCATVLINLVSDVILFFPSKLEISVTRNLISQVFESNYSYVVVFEFVHLLFSCAVFEKDVLSYFINFCTDCINRESDEQVQNVVLISLADVVLNFRPPPQNGDELLQWQRYRLDFKLRNASGVKEHSINELMEKFLENDVDDIFDNLPYFSVVLLLIPHVKPINSLKVLSKLKILMSNVLTLKNFDDVPFVSNQIITAMLLLEDENNFFESFNTDFLINLMTSYPKNVFVLKTVDLLITKAKICNFDLLDSQLMETLFLKLQFNLASPHSQIRLLTLKILSSFELPMPEVENKNVVQINVFRICLAAEKIIPDIRNYREKLQYLLKLDHQLVQCNIPIGSYEHVPLLYLLGALYVNFKLLWDPILKLIESHAYGSDRSMFWSIFLPHLEDVACAIEEKVNLQIPKSNAENNSVEDDFQIIYHNLSATTQENIDFVLHREMLWKSMCSFADIAEVKNRDILSIFFRFIEGEYYKNDIIAAPSQDIRREICKTIEETEIVEINEDDGELIEGEQEANEANGEDDEDNDGEMESDEEDDELKENETETETETKMDDDELSEDEMETAEINNKNVEMTEDEMETDEMNKVSTLAIEDDEILETKGENENKKKISTPKKSKSKNKRKSNDKSDSNIRCTMSSLIAHLSVIAKFRNPRALHREADLRELFENFLSHRNPKVQQLALDFTMSYNDKAVIPYKENLYNMLNDKKFKSEITSFNIDAQSKVVLEEHRNKVLPLLLRIMYGRMNSTIGKNASGRNHSNLRRGIVMRFLAGAKPAELKMFLELAFQPFQKYLNDDVYQTVTNSMISFNLESVFPLRRLQGSLNLLGIIISKVGNLMEEYLPWLLQLLLCMLAIISKLLERKSEIHPRFVVNLRDLRTLAIGELSHFFELFDNYPFSAREIDAVFEVVVWPQLSRLYFESVTSPSSLLRLMQTWSSNPRYFVLFGKHHENDKTLSPVSQILKLYVSNKTRPPVLRIVTNILENFFTFSDYDPNKNEDMDIDEEPEVKAPPIIVNNCVEVDRKKFEGVEEPPNYGTLLLLPHISQIFSRLKFTVAKLSKQTKKGIPETILTILLRCSEHITDPKQCKELIWLLFPFLKKRTSIPGTMEVNVIKTMCVLMKHSAQPDVFVKEIAGLFGSLKYRDSRQGLCDLLNAIAERNHRYKIAAQVTTDLNSWDPIKVEEPNYNQRLDAYKKATEDIAEMINSQMDYALLIIHNSFYVIRTFNDAALRNCSSNFLRELVSQFVFDDAKKNGTCLSLLHSSIIPEVKSGLKSKDEITRHEYLKILEKIVTSCSNVPKLKDLFTLCDEEKEKDFFENIRHVQMHLRARALTRLARSEKLSEFQEDTLSHYLLPLASSFLYSQVYAKHPYLVDAAVEFVGSASRCLSWYRYEMLLKYYLNILPKDLKFQKLSIKLVVAILDGFHFDLSASAGISSGLKEPPTFAKKAVKSKEEMEDDDAMDGVIENEENLEINNKKEDNELKNEKEVLPGQALATRIHVQIVKQILPQLNRCLTKKTRTEDHHKSVRDTNTADEEVLRVPIALAIVKLLQNLPKGSLERNLPGLFFKLCAFLKSRAESVRTTTRETLVKIMDSLGPHYFPYLVKQMHHTMTKGYQVHVMIFSLHAVLNHLLGKLSVGDLDSCVPILISVCSTELFGNVAEEKEVEQIVNSLKEARGCKSYHLYEIMAKFISEDNLVPLVAPIKQTLSTTHRHSMVHKAQECLRYIVLGLSENSSIPATKLLIFAHGLITENIPDLNPKKKVHDKPLALHLQRPDSYLIPSEPKRTVEAATSVKTNAYAFIEFGLHLIYFLLKRGKLVHYKKEHLKMLDPFVSIFVESLSSVHTKIVSFALRCLIKLIKYPLPSLKTHINRLTTSLFVLLNKYAGSEGENMEMTIMGFKLVGVIVREIDFYKMTTDQLRVLLTYVEHDILDYNRQATAFSLLKAILSRKLVDRQINEIMKKVSEMSITSDLERVRVQCRQAFYQYLLDYPLSKALKKHVGFYCAQLCFEHMYGRKSALEMLLMIINNFPLNHLEKYVNIMFVPLSTCVVNDESPQCRKMAIYAIKSILNRFETQKRDFFYGAVLVWLQDSKVAHRRLGAQLCGIFVEVEKEKFASRITNLLPIFVNQLDPSKCSEKNDEEETALAADQLVYYLLTTAMKMIEECNLLENEVWQEDMNLFWEYVQQLLLHRDTKVRLASCQLVGLLFSRISVEELTNAEFGKTTTPGFYLLTQTKDKLLKLCQNLISQLQAPSIDSALQDQLIKNLVYIAKVARAIELHELNVPTSDEDDDKMECEVEKEDGEDKEGIFLNWLIRKMIREAKFEVAHHPSETIKRTCIFKWLAAVALNLGSEGLAARLPLMMIPLHREMSDNSPQADSTLKSLAHQVLDLMKNYVDPATFAQCYADLQKTISEKRTARKRERNLEVILDPVAAQRKRAKKHNAKKEAKKRKIEKRKPTKIRKKSLKDFAMIS